jgi:hypothetical protein
VSRIRAQPVLPACVRVSMLYPKNTEIRNTRQLSILSAEENAEIAESLGLPELDPRWLGASIVIAGFPDYKHIPPGSRLKTKAGTTLTVDLENKPCNWPAREIEKIAQVMEKRSKVRRMGVGV